MSARQVLMLGGDPGNRGGIATVIRVYEAAGLFADGTTRYVATHRDGGSAAKAGAALLALLRVGAKLVTGRVALVHVHMASRASFWRKALFVTMARLARRPVIVHLHGAHFDRFHDEESGPLARFVIRWVFRTAEVVVVLSSQWRDVVLRIAPGAVVHRLPNPIATQPPPSEERRPGTVLFLGRYGERKGIFDLLAAVAELAPRHPHLKLVCAGDGDVAAVHAVVREKGVQAQVEVHGWTGGEAKQALLSRAAIFALPSRAEGLPMSILEAMANGLAIVATRVGGIPEAVDDGEQGFLVAAGDRVALTRALERLLQDPDRCRRMGEAGRQRVDERFAADPIVAELQTLYQRYAKPAPAMREELS